eukprot:1775587-Pleurochrysis_carterae.AAC.10
MAVPSLQVRNVAAMARHVCTLLAAGRVRHASGCCSSARVDVYAATATMCTCTLSSTRLRKLVEEADETKAEAAD